MTNEQLYLLISRLDDDMIEQAEHYPRVVQKRRKRMTRIAAVAACAVVVLAAVFLSIWRPSTPRDGSTFTPPENTVWAGSSGTAGNGGTIGASPDDAGSEWHGWWLDSGLYGKLKDADSDDCFAIKVMRRHPGDQKAFKYNGITYEALLEEYIALRNLKEALYDFPKMYETYRIKEIFESNNSMELRLLYGKIDSNYGEGFLDTYAPNGILQQDKIDAALDKCLDDLEQNAALQEELLEAYRQSCANEDAKRFSASGLTSVVQKGRLYIFVQASELKSSLLFGKDNYILSLASRAAFFEEENSTPSVDIRDNLTIPTLTGYACEKFSFNGEKYGRVRSDKHMAEKFDELLDWQHTVEYIKITVLGGARLTDEEIASLSGSRINTNSVRVNFADMTEEMFRTLHALSQREDVTHIAISVPLVASPD